MNDREFINNLISVYLSNAKEPHQATLDNAITNRLNDIADKLVKQEKVFEIIEKKHISIWRFRNVVFGYEQKQNGNNVNDTYEYYKNHFGYYHEGFEFKLLDEEEFELLKAYFKKNIQK